MLVHDEGRHPSVVGGGRPPDSSDEKPGSPPEGRPPKTGLLFISACQTPILSEIGRWKANIRAEFSPRIAPRLAQMAQISCISKTLAQKPGGLAGKSRSGGPGGSGSPTENG